MAEVDKRAFYPFTYGLYLLSARVGDFDNACIVDAVIQSAAEPRMMTISCIKTNKTPEMVIESGMFCLSILKQETDYTYFERFGMQSGHKVNKFEADVEQFARTEEGLIYDTKAIAYVACKVTAHEDLGSHVLITGEAVEAKVLSSDAPITYAYYREALKSGALAQKQNEHVVTSVAPEQQANAEKSDTLGGKAMDKWVCKVCGYIYEGAEPPEECPICHVGPEMFEKVEGELKLAAEHEYGIYAKTVKDNDAVSAEDKAYILEQLKANFYGECSEVGMYLCMARIAHREGYPEIGLYWEKAAYEEAEHAAKFAELLGEELEPSMKADTKANLAWRVDCEFGATAGKVDLATCAKKNGLDAIHDTVHEMARDEARHGKALKGLLERYFG